MGKLEKVIVENGITYVLGDDDIYLVDDSGYLVGRPILVALLLLVQAVYVGIRVYVKGCKRARGYY